MDERYSGLARLGILAAAVVVSWGSLALLLWGAWCLIR